MLEIPVHPLRILPGQADRHQMNASAPGVHDAPVLDLDSMRKQQGHQVLAVQLLFDGPRLGYGIGWIANAGPNWFSLVFGRRHFFCRIFLFLRLRAVSLSCLVGGIGSSDPGNFTRSIAMV